MRKAKKGGKGGGAALANCANTGGEGVGRREYWRVDLRHCGQRLCERISNVFGGYRRIQSGEGATGNI